MMQARKCAAITLADVLKPQRLPCQPGRVLSEMDTLVSAWSRGSLRTMAHITGHKKTTRTNKKKRAAIQRKKEKKNLAAPVQKKSKAPFRESPIPADYPLGPNNGQGSLLVDAARDVPPQMMAATSSRWAYVASVACQKAGIRPQLLFKGVEGVSVSKFRQQSMFSSTGSFVYFPPHLLNYEYPRDTTQPEVAFLGRSNVGKSSLANALMGSKLAVTSKQPGRTQQPYYYGWISDSVDRRKLDVSMASAFFVDLPGYGFAIGPDKAVDSWQKLTQDYLVTRRESGALRRVFVLQDSRLGVPQTMDDSVCSWLEEAAIPYSVVLTKADAPLLAVKHANICCLRYQHLTSTNEEGICYMSPMIHITSAKKGSGLVELLSTISSELNRE